MVLKLTIEDKSSNCDKKIMACGLRWYYCTWCNRWHTNKRYEYTLSWTICTECPIQPRPVASTFRSNHRVDRVLKVFSTVVRIETHPHPPHLQASVCPPISSWGGTHSLAGEGVGGPIRTRGQTLWKSRYICASWQYLYFFYMKCVSKYEYIIKFECLLLFSFCNRVLNQISNGMG